MGKQRVTVQGKCGSRSTHRRRLSSALESQEEAPQLVRCLGGVEGGMPTSSSVYRGEGHSGSSSGQFYFSLIVIHIPFSKPFFFFNILKVNGNAVSKEMKTALI